MTNNKTKTITSSAPSSSLEPISISSSVLDKRIDVIVVGLPPAYGNNLRSLPNKENISTIVSYLEAMRTETNLSYGYRKEPISKGACFTTACRMGT